MKNTKTIKTGKHQEAVVVCSIIGKKGNDRLPSIPVHSNMLINFIYKEFFQSGGFYRFSHDNHVVYEEISKRIIDDIIKKIKERQGDLDNDPLDGWGKTTNNNGKVVWTREHHPVGDYVPNEKTIILYENNIELYCRDNNKGLDKNIIIHKTYVHEISHAYFHINSTKHKYILEIEEALAELYTLTCLDYLKDTDDAFWKPIFDYAYNAGQNMQKIAGWSAIYGLGAYLYDNLKPEERIKFIEKFPKNIGNINKNNQDVKEYCRFIRYPKIMGYQQKCMNLLQKIIGA